MFCKWCGGDLSESAKKCSRCGRNVPALSECGGFYDLVPEGKKIFTSPVKTDFPGSEPTPQKAPTPVKGKPGKRLKLTKLLLLFTSIGFAVVLVLLFILQGKLKCLEESMDTVCTQTQPMSTSSAPEEELTTPEEEPAPPEQLPAPNEISLQEQAVLLEVTVKHTQTGSSVKITAELGDYPDAIVDEASFDKVTQALTGVQFHLPAAENCIDIRILTNETSLGITFEPDENVFGEAAGDIQYTWSYRIRGAAEWASLEEDIFALSEDGSTVTYSADKLLPLLGEADAAEFCITCTRTNTKNGSLSVILSGISVTKEAFPQQSDT